LASEPIDCLLAFFRLTAAGKLIVRLPVSARGRNLGVVLPMFAPAARALRSGRVRDRLDRRNAA
jgi:hypothetical protein